MALEFEEPVDYFEPPPEEKRPSTPIPPTFDDLPMIMSGHWATAGRGNTLGTSTIAANIPEWRLAVPHRPRR